MMWLLAFTHFLSRGGSLTAASASATQALEKMQRARSDGIPPTLPSHEAHAAPDPPAPPVSRRVPRAD